MVTTQEALDLVLKSTPVTTTEIISIEDSNNRVLSKEIRASRAYPPFDRVIMDGIAISKETTNREFPIEKIIRAGENLTKLENKDACIEVMTGCMLPTNCDFVIPYEEVEIKDAKAKIIKSDYTYKRFVHERASDYNENDLLIEKNTLVTSAVISVIASQGIKEIEVYKLPKITIISSGNELKELSESIEQHQIYRSNPYTLEKELKGLASFEILKVHMQDDLSETIQTIESALEQSDIVIISGGVSKGKFDFIPKALEELNVKKIFHRVSQRPGKPLYYGVKNNKQVFGLPGNPVSSLVCLRKYVMLSIEKRIGIPRREYFGVLTRPITFKNDLTYFVGVSESYDKNGTLLLTPIETNTSGDFNSFCHTTGIIELPKARQDFRPGESYPYYPWN